MPKTKQKILVFGDRNYDLWFNLLQKEKQKTELQVLKLCKFSILDFVIETCKKIVMELEKTSKLYSFFLDTTDKQVLLQRLSTVSNQENFLTKLEELPKPELLKMYIVI